MGLHYISLDETTRLLMAEEFNYDISCDNCYSSKRFNDLGRDCYIEIMPKHLMDGTDDDLAEELKGNDCFKTHEPRGATMVKVPVTAAQTFAEGEFNRFYVRALCQRAINEGKTLEIYRARPSQNPRPESENLIGETIDPTSLLNDLRENKGMDTAFNLPNGPNSGLSVKLV